MAEPARLRWERWQAQLLAARGRVAQTHPLERSGRISRATGIVLEATGIRAPLGAGCRIESDPGHWVDASIVGFRDGRVYLMAQDDITGLQSGARVMLAHPINRGHVPCPAADEDLAAWAHQQEAAAAVQPERRLPVGEALLGRVLDANGAPLDSLGGVGGIGLAALGAAPINPLSRAPIDTALDVGIRAINGLLTVGRGQRLGLFAGSGVGKSVLLGMMARFTAADVVIVGLIGERGREVKAFIEQNLGSSGLQRAIVVAAPADVSPLLRLQGARYATRLAEYFRDRGRHVLLIMDSLTRYAMAQREIALAIGEPPVTRGYPPSVFAQLPKLVERAGNGTVRGGGSITAFYTVLTEGDDQQDPIADAARAILDGHIVLSRALAESGHYPAIDIEASVSRVIDDLLDPAVRRKVYAFKRDFALYARNRDLIAAGVYARGADAALDAAIDRYPDLARYLQQAIEERADTTGARALLTHLYPGDP